MPVSLNRIEREYIIQNLNDVLPPLSILSGDILYTIPSRTYSVEAGFLSFKNTILNLETETDCRVFFRHKMCGMYFFSKVIRTADNFFRCELSPDFFMEDVNQSLDSTGRVRFSWLGNFFESHTTAEYPLEHILVDPDVCIEKSETMKKIARKTGIDVVPSLMLFRLFEFLDAFNGNLKKTDNGSTRGELVFMDHQYLVFSICGMGKNSFEKGSKLDLMIFYKKRKIMVTAFVCGIIPVFINLSVLCVNINNAQEEDKRFLYEMLYKRIYQT